jgi:SAM-dependent methyltransferase
VADPATGWVPAPTYILRRAAILDWLKKSPPGRVLEIGCGPGALLGDLARAGYNGLGVESSADARRIAPRLIGDMPGIAVADRLPEQATQTFDYVMAFEVLEHIENDSAALASWVKYLRPDGHVLLSLPAHRHRWNVTDIAAGHFRRYDRADVERLLRDAGLRIERLGSYGWPVSRVNEALRLAATRRSLRRSGIDPAAIARGDADRTAQSGVDRRLETRLFPLYGGLVGRAFFSLAIAVQRLSYDSSRGISFLVMARKSSLT